MLSDVLYQGDAIRFLRGVVEGRTVSPLLLVGPVGTGRRYAAIQATKELFCSGDRNSTCACLDCLQVGQGTHPDLVQIQALDGKDIGVDAVREVIEAAYVYPTQARLKVFLLDGADRFTVPAANALLKTLEEPPAMARFFLLAETFSQVLPTIRSRCGRLDFRALPEDFILQQVRKFEPDPTKALVYARLGEGSVGRAIQYWGSGRLALRDKALDLLSRLLSKDRAGIFLGVDQLEKDLPLTLLFLDTLVYDLLVLNIDSTRVVNLDRISTLQTFSSVPASTLHRLHKGLADMLNTYRTSKIQLGFHAKTLLLELMENPVPLAC